MGMPTFTAADVAPSVRLVLQLLKQLAQLYITIAVVVEA